MRVDQHDGIEIITTSELSNSVAPKFEPADAILMKINDNGYGDELVVFPGVQGNVPYGRPVRSGDYVVVVSKVLPSPVVLDGVAALVITSDRPLHKLVKSNLCN